MKLWPDDTARVAEELARATIGIGIIATVIAGSPPYVTGLLAAALTPRWVWCRIASNAAEHWSESRKLRRRPRGPNRRRSS